MWIRFSVENMALSDQLREWAESRLWMALRPCDEKVRWATGQIRRDTQSGSICCNMQASLSDGQMIASQQFADDPYHAVAAAAESLRRLLARHARSKQQTDESAELAYGSTEDDEALVAAR